MFNRYYTLQLYIKPALIKSTFCHDIPLFRVSKKWLNATFLSFTGFASRISSLAAKPAKYENLWVFIRSDAHVVRDGLNIRGCGPLSTPGFFDRLKEPAGSFCLA